MSATGDGNGEGLRERLGVVRLRRGRQAAWEWRRGWEPTWSLYTLNSVSLHSLPPNKPRLYFTDGKQSWRD